MWENVAVQNCKRYMLVTDTGDCSYKMSFTLVWNLVFSNAGSANCIIDRLKFNMSLGEYHF